MGIAASTVSLSAQTLFTRPDTTPDYGSYREVDDCLAAVTRLEADSSRNEAIWRDTAVFDSAYHHRGIRTSTIELARGCLASVSVDTVPLREVHAWAAALLTANRDDDVRAMYLRYFDSIPPADYREEFLKIVRVYSEARPRRMSDIKQVYHIAAAQIPVDSIEMYVGMRMMIADIVQKDGGNEDFLFHLIDEIFEAADSSTIARFNRQYKLALVSLSLVRHQRELLDSLSASTQSYHSYAARITDPIVKGLFASMYDGKASSIEGDFWFRSNATISSDGDVDLTETYSKSSPEVRPVLGRVNLIFFLQGVCHTSSPYGNSRGRKNGYRQCAREFSALRRLKKAYPELEITIISSTYGFFADAPPLAPADEADTLAKYFLGFNKVPATLVVKTTDFFRLPGYDQRRIDTNLDERFTFGGRNLGGHGVFLLLDEQGLMVLNGGIRGADGAVGEREMYKYLDALYKRVGRQYTNLQR